MGVEVRCSVFVARGAGALWSGSGNESGAGNRRAFNLHILIASHTRFTFGLSMQLEFHQLDLRWEHLRVRQPARQRRLLASLAESGQQMPIVVVAAEGQTDRGVGESGPGHGRSGGVANERSGGRAAGPLAAFIRTRNRTGGRLVTGG